MCNSLVPVPGTSDGAGSGAGLRQSVVLQSQQGWGARECLSHVTGSSQITACHSGYTLPSAKKHKGE